MEPTFSWDNQLHPSSGGLATSMNFQNDHSTINHNVCSFSWAQDNQTTWSVPEGCPPKRLKLEDHVQDKPEDVNIQSLYLNQCFQNSGDLTKDPSGFSYLPQTYLSKRRGFSSIIIF